MKVLVLEGDDRVSRGLERTLRVLGHEVLRKPFGRHELEALLATPGPSDSRP